jgi:predicted GTPase
LLPGQYWEDQLYAAIETSDITLLVVSQASMASEYVRDEWQHAIAKNKPVILLIFEACRLPDELKDCAWIDFRRVFDAAIWQLTSLLKGKTSLSPQELPPQKGFLMPPPSVPR